MSNYIVFVIKFNLGTSGLTALDIALPAIKCGLIMFHIYISHKALAKKAKKIVMASSVDLLGPTHIKLCNINQEISDRK